MDLNKDIKDIHLNINSTTFNILYRKYKSFVLPSIIIIACIILFFMIIIPQIQALLDAKDKEKIERQKLELLKNNYNLLLNMDLTKLNSDFEILARTLPSGKDFAGIINAISDKSVKAGVTIGDFEFTVGDITKPQIGDSAFPSILISLDVAGDSKAVLSFVTSLYKSMPLSAITTIEQGGDSARIKLQFYYKTFPQGPISNETPISAFTSNDISLISELTSWGTPIEVDFIPLSPNVSDGASDSGIFEASSSAEEL